MKISQVKKLRKISSFYSAVKEKILALTNALFATSISGCLEIKEMDPVLCSAVCNSV